MKLSRLVIAIIAVAMFFGCEPPPPKVPVSKVVVEKIIATEQRLTFDFFDSKNELRERATTVYYIVAADGTIVEVDLKEYVKIKVGQNISSTEWK